MKLGKSNRPLLDDLYILSIPSSASLSSTPLNGSGTLAATWSPHLPERTQASRKNIYINFILERCRIPGHAPPRGKEKTAPHVLSRTAGRKDANIRKNGGDLLSHGYAVPRVCSTIGAHGLNCSVRNGKRWNPGAITALMPKKHEGKENSRRATRARRASKSRDCHPPPPHGGREAGQEKHRAISSARLWCRHLYTCALSTSSSLTALIEI